MSGRQQVAIRDVVRPVGTHNPARASSSAEFVYIDLSAVDQDRKVIAGARQVACSEAPSRARQLVVTNDVLVSTVRPNLNGVACVSQEMDGATASTGFCVLRPDAARIDAAYLFQWVKTSDFVADMVRKATGASYPAVSDRIVLDSCIPLPSLSAQRRIAEVLDRTDALRTKRRDALAQLDSLTQSIFLDMFGNPVTNPLNWPVARFRDACERVTVGIVVQPASYYQTAGVPALRSLNVKPGMIVMDNLVYFSKEDNATKLKKSRLKSGDIVLVRSGQPGTAAVVPPELDDVNAIDLLIATPDPDQADSTYLCAFFNSQGGRTLALSAQRGQIQKHLNVGSLNEALVPSPPLALQRKFAERITVVETLKATHCTALAELDALFASLQHRAFRGEL